MKDRPVDELVDRIRYLLLTERALLTDGRAAEVLALGADKSAAIEEFENMLRGPSASGMATVLREHVNEIARLAKENELHFLAILYGLKSLIVRLENIDDSTRTGVYNQCGDDVRFSGAVGGYVKKA